MRSFQPSDANFALAWKALEDSYQNIRLIIRAHLSKLFGQEKIVKESGTALRQLIRTTSGIVRSLDRLLTNGIIYSYTSYLNGSIQSLISNGK